MNHDNLCAENQGVGSCTCGLNDLRSQLAAATKRAEEAETKVAMKDEALRDVLCYFSTRNLGEPANMVAEHVIKALSPDACVWLASEVERQVAPFVRAMSEMCEAIRGEPAMNNMKYDDLGYKVTTLLASPLARKVLGEGKP